MSSIETNLPTIQGNYNTAQGDIDTLLMNITMLSSNVNSPAGVGFTGQTAALVTSMQELVDLTTQYRAISDDAAALVDPTTTNSSLVSNIPDATETYVTEKLDAVFDN